MKILSRYMCTNCPITSWNIEVINLWNMARALQSPICIMLLTYIPIINKNTILQILLSQIHTCSYTFIRSIFDLNFACAISFQITFWSGKGATSFTVLSLCWWTSNAVLNVLYFFRIHNRGITWEAGLASHYWAFKYHLVLSVVLQLLGGDFLIESWSLADWIGWFLSLQMYPFLQREVWLHFPCIVWLVAVALSLFFSRCHRGGQDNCWLCLYGHQAISIVS